jgi:hypothetical protein
MTTEISRREFLILAGALLAACGSAEGDDRMDAPTLFLCDDRGSLTDDTPLGS